MGQDPNSVVVERVELLTRFQKDIRDWFDGKYEGDQDALRSRINKSIHPVRRIVKDAGCLKLMTIEPPRAIGGKIKHGIDPFASLFEDHYGRSLIPNVADMVDETVGMIESPEYLERLACEDKIKNKGAAELAHGLARLIHICRRFPLVARQLQVRHDNRSKFAIDDEYDVQDLMHSLLRIDFEDVRREEWTPSYGGSASRMDFLLKRERIVLEIKKTRHNLKTKEVADQLLVDIARYEKHPDCSALVCFVYDPENKIMNPAALEDDLSEVKNGRDVHVVVAPLSF